MEGVESHYFQNFSTHILEEERETEENRSEEGKYQASSRKSLLGSEKATWYTPLVVVVVVVAAAAVWMMRRRRFFLCNCGPYTRAKVNVSFDVQYILTSHNAILILKNNFSVVHTRKLEDE